MLLPPRTLEDGLAFRPRSHDVSRLEGFSDAVFGFAITLLVVSLEVPHTFDDLLETLKGTPAFLVSFFLLFTIWHGQYRWFRRYGLHDAPSLVLNGMLLFLVVLFVYPLKFVSTLLFAPWMGLNLSVRRPDGSLVAPIQPGQEPAMMIIFGMGYAAVFIVFALLHVHALRRARQLGLDELERVDTHEHLRENLINAASGIVSIVVAAATKSLAKSGAVYLISAIALAASTVWSASRRRRVRRSHA
jgi:uncharacterized membrane protein